MRYNITRTIYKAFFLVVLAVSVCNYAIAQDDPEPDDGPGTPCPPDSALDDCDPDNDVPIDGGAGILVAAGVAYGIKKVYDKRKQNKTSAAA
ncbi:PID-CTERM protein-sorting domain-containing protein [Pedobacter nanyangensis]|uniref:PID-CTERM protein-sorting domain-containing protein n=1 Tax=Pedobacter nanyangensis TaxID=1562389 RepID=UPI0013B3661D|nr:hypothetical protein [Pedobacter nanyangensis]